MTLFEFAQCWGFDAESSHLRAALTHRSATAVPGENNERLEFLGDALLSAFVARFLMDALPVSDEGTLSRARSQVVRKETIAQAARAIGISEILIVGQGERKAQRHTHDALLADAYEAVVGALFLERGEIAAQHFVCETLSAALQQVVSQPPDPDPKTTLQILLQSRGRGLPIYTILAETVGGHDNYFRVEARTETGETLGQGAGSSKRVAETEAAQQAVQYLRQESATDTMNSEL